MAGCQAAGEWTRRFSIESRAVCEQAANRVPTQGRPRRKRDEASPRLCTRGRRNRARSDCGRSEDIHWRLSGYERGMGRSNLDARVWVH